MAIAPNHKIDLKKIAVDFLSLPRPEESRKSLSLVLRTSNQPQAILVRFELQLLDGDIAECGMKMHPDG